MAQARALGHLRRCQRRRPPRTRANPTEAANTIVPLAERIDLLFAELKDAANATSETPSGPIRIAVSPVVADHFLIPRFADLQEHFPGVRFDVTAEISRVNVSKREADIAIRQHPSGKSPAEPSALAVKVGQMGFAAFASPAYLARNGRPVRPVCSLAGHRLISTGTWAPGDAWNAQLDEPASLTLSVYPFSVAKAASLAGLGIAVLPCVGSDTDPGLERVSEVIHHGHVGRHQSRRTQQSGCSRRERTPDRDVACGQRRTEWCRSRSTDR